MTKISDALTYGLTIRESADDGSDFTSPPADYRRLFLGEDGALHLKSEAGTVTAIGGGDITTDTAWAAKGDLIAGTANNTAAVLTAGTNGKVLTTASGEATGLKWETPTGGGGLLGYKSYSSGSDNAWGSTASATSVDIDATNAKLDITVPASGNIFVMISCLVSNTVAQDYGWLTVNTGAGPTELAAQLVTWAVGNGFGQAAFAVAHPSFFYVITGQAPGALTIKAGIRTTTAGTINAYANTGAGDGSHRLSPFIMAAWPL